MYAELMKNLRRLKLTNGELGNITQMGCSIEDQKPFLVYRDTENKKAYLSFVYGNNIYVTMFRSANIGIVSRLRTVIDMLDTTVKPVDLAQYLVRSGIPLKVMTFDKREIVLTEINSWDAMYYIFNAGPRIESLVRDLRDLLYV